MLVLLAIITFMSFILVRTRKTFTIERMTNASDCQQSISDFNAALELQKKQDQDNYNEDLNKWNAQKNAFQSDFASDPVKWRQFCQGGVCPVQSFFRKIPNTDIGGYDLSGNPRQSDASGCLQMCLDRDDCLWCQYQNNGNCWLKGNTNNDTNWTHYFKTNTGWKTVNNLYIGGYDIPNGNDQRDGNPPNFSKADSLGADNISTRNDGVSWYKRFDVRRWDGDTYIKNTKATYTFPDSSPVILNNVGPKPIMHHTPVELSVVCQDCRQSLGSNQVTDSTQINMSQFNQCVANIEKNTNTNPPTNTTSNTTSNTTTKPETSTNTAPTNTTTETSPTTNSPTPTTSSETSNTSVFANKGLLIGGGVSLLLTIIIVVIIIIISNKKQS